MVAKRFNPTAKHSARAVQAWQILIGMAMNRQTTTYKTLSNLMYGRNAPGVIGKVLLHVAFFCKDKELPPLTSIVVGQSRGTPGIGIPANPATLNEERERVYARNWYDVYPPSEGQLKKSYARHGRS